MNRCSRALALLVFGAWLCVLPGCVQVQDSVRDTFSSEAKAPEIKPAPRYLDFGNVLIPGELKRVESDTYLLNDHGRLVVTGRVQGDSLARFFRTAMANDGWRMLNEYTFQGSIKQFYLSGDAVASILIAENPLDTKVEIWLTPLGTR